jgi:hypothetical protein
LEKVIDKIFFWQDRHCYQQFRWELERKKRNGKM